jgi:hypothetical protein
MLVKEKISAMKKERDEDGDFLPKTGKNEGKRLTFTSGYDSPA